MAENRNLIGFIDPPTKGLAQTVTFDVAAFEHAIASHGVRLRHYRAMRCPQGMIDKYDNRAPDHAHAGCSNGYLYRPVGSIMALFTGNSSGQRLTDVGYVDGSTVQVTLNRFYEPSESGVCPDVFVANFDRFYLEEDALMVPTWQLVETHITGRDKLQYPALEVTDLVDTNGKEYRQGVDFELDERGIIVWGDNKPGYNMDAGKGEIYSVRYLYRPYYYVKNMGHQIRMAQVQKEDGSRGAVRMPQAMLVQREYMWENEVAPEPGLKPSGHVGIVPMPADLSFGPR